MEDLEEQGLKSENLMIFFFLFSVSLSSLLSPEPYELWSINKLGIQSFSEEVSYDHLNILMRVLF